MASDDDDNEEFADKEDEDHLFAAKPQFEGETGQKVGMGWYISYFRFLSLEYVRAAMLNEFHMRYLTNILQHSGTFSTILHTCSFFHIYEIFILFSFISVV